MSGLVVFWLVTAAGTLGVITGLFCAHLPEPPATLHERCHERFQRTVAALQREIRAQEAEIRRLMEIG